ncbi:hypothetical protein F3Y22_tig00112216pilonHSYRG00011 [Hibiscus syriacus]|uniref:Uncharacterized protein n=1 Tax=Hibiscus syriacus TaxID=106335 RepID=A0A6A2YD16_HIBSY|nr:hypothetical protein F3Y22_tig00112216pilonHSYRG00011 [Hibiscus syriacus]
MGIEHIQSGALLTYAAAILGSFLFTSTTRRRLVVVFFIFDLFVVFGFVAAFDAESLTEAEINVTASQSNVSDLRSKEDSFADMIDRELEKEFNDTGQNEATDPGSFNMWWHCFCLCWTAGYYWISTCGICYWAWWF